MEIKTAFMEPQILQDTMLSLAHEMVVKRYCRTPWIGTFLSVRFNPQNKRRFGAASILCWQKQNWESVKFWSAYF